MESFNRKFCDEPPACEAFNTLAEAKVLIEQWRVPLQHGASAQLARLPATSAQSRPVEDADAHKHAKSGRVSRGGQQHNELRFHLDHSMGGWSNTCKLSGKRK